MTTVVNLYKESYDQYIGRRGHGHDGYFGNPYPIKEGEPRGKSLDRYRTYFNYRLRKDPVFRERILSLRDKTLGCFCKPLPCHGDIIAEYLNNLK